VDLRAAWIHKPLDLAMQGLVVCFIRRHWLTEANGKSVKPHPVSFPRKHLKASLNCSRHHGNPGFPDQYFEPFLKRLYSSVDRSFPFRKHAWNQAAFDALDGEAQTRSCVAVRIDRENFQKSP